MYTPKIRTLSCFAILLLVCVACIWFFSPMRQAQAQISPAVPKELTSYRDVVKNVLPAVVSIEHESKAVAMKAPKPRTQPWPNDFRLPDDFRKLFDNFQIPFDLPETPRGGFGSGFIVDRNGVILTNHHVVKGADQVTVCLQDGRTFVSKDIKSDPKTDLAVIRIEAKSPLPRIEFGDSSAMEIGDRVLAMGAPFGLIGSVSAGIISGKGRNPNITIYEDFLQTDAAINPGNSGGPLVNLEGKVIGVNTAIKSNSGGSQGVGLAIPSSLARNVMDKLLKDGVVHRGYLGVQLRKLDPEVGVRLGADNKTGVIVAWVMDGSPAAKAGIQAGDIITALGGASIKDPGDLQRRVVELPLKKAVTVSVIRDGKSQDLQATIEDQPADFGQARKSSLSTPDRTQDGIRLEKIGIEIGDLTPDVAKRFGYAKTTTGAVITRVEPDTLAAEADLEAGTLITKVDSTRVTSAAEGHRALEKVSLERGILLELQYPQSGVGYVMLKVASGR